MVLVATILACAILSGCRLLTSPGRQPDGGLLATHTAPIETASRPALPGAAAQPSPAPETSPQPALSSSTAVPSISATGNPANSGVFIPQVGRSLSPTQTPMLSVPAGINILIILSDDQRYDTMAYMPRTQSRIFDQGITFSRAYITTPSCCPSRASLLTGLYAYNHAVHDNQDSLGKPTFVEDLHAAGYYTGIVGKYLNSWDGSQRTEFDFWVSFAGGASPYFDPRLNVNGEWKDHSGYMTYILRDYASDFLDNALDREAPFILLFTPNAPHEPSEPAPGDDTLYPDLPLHRPPSFDEEDVSDKPDWLQEYEPLTEERIQAIDDLRLEQIQSLNALDEAVESLIVKLEEAGELDNTLVVYLSDNGYFWGEHRRRRGKGYAWEEAILVPFAIRYPPLIPKARVEAHMVANIDLAPTIYQLAGLTIPAPIDGLSLVPLLQGNPEWRDRLVIENWVRFGPYTAVRTDRYLYVEWDNDRTELYDMENDPYQLDNQAENPEYAEVLADLHNYLRQVRPERD
jgi:arylsulfatase A-like enzyme